MATVTLEPSNSAQDGNEEHADSTSVPGTMVLTDTMIRLGTGGSPFQPRINFVKFDLPYVGWLDDNVLTEVKLRLLAKFGNSGAFDQTLYFEDGSDPSDLTSVAFNLSGRSRTTKSCSFGSVDMGSWSPAVTYDYTSADGVEFTEFFDELIASHGRPAIGSVAMIFDYENDGNTNNRIFYSKDDGANNPAQLILTYLPNQVIDEKDVTLLRLDNEDVTL